MPIITKRQAVLDIYKEASRNSWVIPCFCSENLTTTEAVLEACRQHASDIGLNDLPIILAITNQYDHRTQSKYYTHTKRWDIGLRLFLADLKVLASEDSPYADLRIMVHLDHTQFDDDQELLEWDMDQFSSIMFDASKVPFVQNIRLTRQFVESCGRQIVIEGACDEIVDATGTQRSDLTTADKARQYLEQTGVDLIVANLGTEHRASSKELQYRGDYARQIKEQIGTKIVLHGTSSVPSSQITHLFSDGICKVNIWTALERDAAPDLLKDMVRHASEVGGEGAVETLKAEGLLTESCPTGKASLDYFTTVYRQDIVFGRMKEIVLEYLRLWMTRPTPS